MPKKFVHPKSRQVVYEAGKALRDKRVAAKKLEHRSATRQPVLLKLRWFQDHLRKDMDRTKYTAEELRKMALDYIVHYYSTEIAPVLLEKKKSPVAAMAMTAKEKEFLDTIVHGTYTIPDLTDPSNVQTLILWNNSMKTAPAVNLINVKFTNIRELIPQMLNAGGMTEQANT